jgi:hypothetical protein
MTSASRADARVNESTLRIADGSGERTSTPRVGKPRCQLRLYLIALAGVLTP